MTGSLDGLLVLDLTSHLSGPYCTMMLADHGAEVIKIERPGKGDDARKMPPFVNGESAPFMIWNRNKKSVVLDFKLAADRDTLLTMVDQADILIENFRPGTLDKLGIGWEVLHARNPRLIYAAISGFGQTGPYRNRGGFDLITQGMSGLASINGPEDGEPYRLPIAISDVTAGMFLAFGVLAAIQARHKTGQGQFVETSLLEAATSLGVYEAAHYFATGERPPRIGQKHRGSSPYRIFATADGYISFGASQENFWDRFCRIIDMPELRDDARFRTNADRVAHNDALIEIVQARLQTRPAAYWLAELEKAGIPCGPVLNYDEVLTDPQILARDMVVATTHPITGPFKTLGVPVKLSETAGQVHSPAPRLGEHTAEILERFKPD
ncbi:CaiB/BaiF CoA-transferase family protein [Acidisphaera sp. L21]|uniref:CaiB/BaiF CoA transferase family protein n=1 Tax=Acidisphaera sp. L21 TaxID=1641851 RepID=UPI00131CB68C|nr:CoA transferase [Acidisphaera sp. L21]